MSAPPLLRPLQQTKTCSRGCRMGQQLVQGTAAQTVCGALPCDMLPASNREKHCAHVHTLALGHFTNVAA